VKARLPLRQDRSQSGQNELLRLNEYHPISKSYPFKDFLSMGIKALPTFTFLEVCDIPPKNQHM
jgi:hypothetical protein